MMRERDERNYIFYNPQDVTGLLSDIIKKKAYYAYNKKRSKEIKKDWWYYSSDNIVKNISLLFGKFIPEPEDNKEKDENKHKYLEFVINEFNKFITSEINIQENILKRQEIAIKSLCKKNYKIESFLATLQWRMVIGFGAVHSQETSMTLHHIYGIPYIPGSAVKGVTRHWVILDKFDGDEHRAEKKDEFQKVFGTQEKKGEVIFFDAYPVGDINLRLDVMTPHYRPYYSEGSLPADYHNPTPVKFLTVERTKFRFYLASKDENLLNKAKDWLKEAIGEYGIGAKTSLGYGIFE